MFLLPVLVLLLPGTDNCVPSRITSSNDGGCGLVLAGRVPAHCFISPKIFSRT